MTNIWIAIKYTGIGKLGAALVGSAPLMFAVELGSHLDALIAALPPTAAVILGVIALKKGQKTMMVNIDGRMEQLLKVTGQAEHAKGKIEEKAEARERLDVIKVAVEEESHRPRDVTVVNEPNDPANVKIGNKPTESVPVSLAERQTKIDKSQERLDKDVEKQHQKE